MSRYRNGTKMKRVQIPVPEETLAEIDRCVLEAGMYYTYFYSNAFILGARVLGAIMSPGRLGLQGLIDEELKTLVRELTHETVRGSNGKEAPSDRW